MLVALSDSFYEAGVACINTTWALSSDPIILSLMSYIVHFPKARILVNFMEITKPYLYEENIGIALENK